MRNHVRTVVLHQQLLPMTRMILMELELQLLLLLAMPILMPTLQLVVRMALHQLPLNQDTNNQMHMQVMRRPHPTHTANQQQLQHRQTMPQQTHMANLSQRIRHMEQQQQLAMAMDKHKLVAMEVIK